MGLLTESELRMRLKGQNLDALKEFTVESGTVVTPAAREFLIDHKISLIYEGKIAVAAAIECGATENPFGGTCLDRGGQNQNENDSNLPPFVPPKRYETIAGAYYDVKPEHMTAIRGPKLVNKDHPIISFRGKLDSMQARILEVQIAFQKMGMQKVIEDLSAVLAFVREIMRSEVLNYEFAEQPLLGMGFDEIRMRSHTPKKYYGIGHFAAGLEHGEGVILLNTLRAQVREAELAAYDAFKDEYGVPEPGRSGIILALNRLSSLFYVMMFKVLAKEYEP